MSTDPLSRDFRNFLYLIWKNLNLPDPTPVQYDIAKTLMGSTSRLAIQAFRGVGKSWITAAYVLWELYRNPQIKIMVVSATESRSANFTRFCLQLINLIPELSHLRPKSGQRQSSLEFDVGPALADQTPSVFARSITGQLTGGRADIIVSDDVEIPTNSDTATKRDQLKERLKEYSAILKPVREDLEDPFVPRIIYLGTPQNEDSIYVSLPSTFRTVIWPAHVPMKDQIEAYRGNLAAMIQDMFDQGRFGEITDPRRFSESDLADRRAEYGAAGYQLQFMLNTKLSDEDRYPLKVRNLVIASVPPEKAPMEVFWMPSPDRKFKDLPNMAMAGDEFFSPAGFGAEFAEYRGRVLAIDPSGRGSDETGYAVGFQLNGNIWVPEAGGLPGGYDDKTLKELAKFAKSHRVNSVIVEGNFGDGMWLELFRPILNEVHPCELLEVTSKGTKEMRILDTLEPVVTNHRLILDPSVVQKDYDTAQKYEGDMRVAKTLINQMTRICREKGALRKDDRIDALAILVSHFTDVMGQDAKANAAKAHAQRLQRELLKHVKGDVGAKPKRKRWASV